MVQATVAGADIVATPLKVVIAETEIVALDETAAAASAV